jgi:hypothetical protein
LKGPGTLIMLGIPSSSAAKTPATVIKSQMTKSNFSFLIISVASSIHYLEHLFYLSAVALCTIKSSIVNPLHVR